MNTKYRFRRRAGFTMIEIMAVIIVLALLAAVAGSSLRRSIMRSRTSEAVMNLNAMWAGAVAYFNTLHATADGAYLPPQFPASAPITPAEEPSRTPYIPNPSDWEHPSWDALNFSMASPHYYQYGFLNLADGGDISGGTGAYSADGPFGGAGGPMGDGPFGE